MTVCELWLQLRGPNVLERVLNYDFRNGAKKSGHFDHPLQSCGQIYFNIFRHISAKVG